VCTTGSLWRLLVYDFQYFSLIFRTIELT
jgi:hypothetical protein